MKFREADEKSITWCKRNIRRNLTKTTLFLQIRKLPKVYNLVHQTDLTLKV